MTLIPLTLLLAGCSTIGGQRGDLKLRATRWFWQSEDVSFSVKDPQGFVVTLKIGKSRTDSESVNAVTEAVVAGLVKGVIGRP